MANELTKIPKFRRCVLQNFPFIEQDFDALTDYQLLCKVVEYLNKVITSQNGVIEVAESLTVAFNQLQSFVEDYFENLDVQEEINNKLDEMADSGQLADIIAQYLGLAGMLVFNTVADMKAGQNLVNGSICKTLGYHAINDGGMATYKVRTITNDDVVDEMYIIELSDDNLIAELIVDEFITPEILGAYGDDEHDDTLAIASLTKAKAKILFGKEKTYKITETIQLSSNDNIDMNNSSIDYIIDTSKSYQQVFNGVDVNNVVICNGNIHTDYKSKLTTNTQVIGIHLLGTKNCEVFNMDIENCAGPLYPSGVAEIYLGISSNNDSDKNYIHDCVFHGVHDEFNVRVYSPFKTVGDHEAKNNVVERCKFYYAKKSCVEIAGITTHDNIVKDCEVMDCGTEAMDIDKTSYNNTIRNVIVHQCTGSDEAPEYLPFGGISIQHYNASDAVSGYYSHNNIVENCIVENTVGCGFYTNTRDFKFINCVCKNAQIGMTISAIQYPTDKLPLGEVDGCELHGTIEAILFDRPGDVTIDKCILIAPTGIQAIAHASDSVNTVISVINSEIHHGYRGIYGELKNFTIENNKFYDDQTPLTTLSSGGVFVNKFSKVYCNNNQFFQTTIRDINVICDSTSTPSNLITVTNNMISLNSSVSAKINITGGQVKVANVIGNSIAAYINSSLVVDKLYNI